MKIKTYGLGMLKKFCNWFTVSARGERKKGHPDLHPIDIDKLANELKLVDEAKRFGEAGLPSPDALSISGPEAAVVQKVEKARQDYVDWAVFRLNVLSQDLGRRNITHDVNRASQADNEFERKANAMLDDQDSILSTLGEAAMSQKIELEDFRNKNQLTRKAHYPTTGRSYLLYGILGLFIMIEGGLNSAFFAQGMDSGLFGGFAMAATLAGVNVFVAFLLGKFAIRYVNDVGLGAKAFGFLAILFTITFMVAMGFGIAHYRDALTEDVQAPAQTALATLKADPTRLQDVFSWALFAISVTFGIGAVFDGLYSDDLYPGYGAISRRTRATIDDYEDELKFLRDELAEAKDNELVTLDKAIQRAQATTAVFESLINDKRTAASRLSTALRDADHSLEALLRKFRTENELHRRGVPRPTYFDHLPSLRALQVPDFDTAVDEAALAAQRNQINSLLVAVEDIRARIQSAYNQKFDRLRPLDANFVDTAVQ